MVRRRCSLLLLQAAQAWPCLVWGSQLQAVMGLHARSLCLLGSNKGNISKEIKKN